jgi:hypothetical protein
MAEKIGRCGTELNTIVPNIRSIPLHLLNAAKKMPKFFLPLSIFYSEENNA